MGPNGGSVTMVSGNNKWVWCWEEYIDWDDINYSKVNEGLISFVTVILSWSHQPSSSSSVLKLRIWILNGTARCCRCVSVTRRGCCCDVLTANGSLPPPPPNHRQLFWLSHSLQNFESNSSCSQVGVGTPSTSNNTGQQQLGGGASRARRLSRILQEAESFAFAAFFGRSSLPHSRWKCKNNPNKILNLKFVFAWNNEIRCISH